MESKGNFPFETTQLFDIIRMEVSLELGLTGGCSYGTINTKGRGPSVGMEEPQQRRAQSGGEAASHELSGGVC